jgi:hypothetical protein
VIGSILAVVAAHLVFALTPDPWIVAIARPTGDRLINLYNLTLGWLGPGLVLVGAAVLWRVVVRRRSLGSPPSARRPAPRWRRDFGARFLTGWLAIEGLAYLGISTFPAARRVLGVFVVLVLITCRLASRAGRLDPSRRRLVPWVAALGVSLGLLYFAVDLDDAWAERATAQRVKERVAAAGGGAIWYLATNWGGFQCYAPRAGLRPVMPDRSWLSRGDWLVIPWNIQVRNRLTLADSCVTPVAALPWGRLLPLSTRDAFYHGTRPIRRADPSWRSAVLYRVVGEGRLVGTQEHPHQR